MRTYILTDKEREMIEAYLEDQEFSELEMSRLYTIRSRAKQSIFQLGVEVDLLILLLEKSRRPKCFGTERAREELPRCPRGLTSPDYLCMEEYLCYDECWSVKDGWQEKTPETQGRRRAEIR